MSIGFFGRAFSVWFLTVALSLVGAPCALAAFVLFGAHTLATPVVDAATFSLVLPVTNGEAVGTATATNSPTSWAISACSPSCATYFAISSGGDITVTSAGASAIIAQTYSLTVTATNSLGNGANTITVPITAPAGYAGLIDHYPSLGVTWGFSAYKLLAAYSGNWATIQRASDSATQAIGFLSPSGVADAATLAAFCAGTVCYVTTLNDSTGNGNDATCTNVRAFIAADGRPALAPQAGGKCIAAYSATFSTVKQEMFAVASPMFQDGRTYQAGVPTYVTTGTVTSGSGTITALASSAGISADNNLEGQPATPGVQDSAGCLPGSGANSGSESFSAIGGGTVTLSPQPGFAGPSCTQIGDNLTFTNAVLGGVWATQGPNADIGSAYWSFGIGVNSTGDGYASDAVVARNAALTTGMGSIGQAMRQTLGVWDYDTFTGLIYYDGTKIGDGIGSSANITYGSHVALTLFEAPNGTDQLQNAVFEQMVLVNQTASNRVAVASWLQAQYSIAPPPFLYTTTDGFVLKSELLAPYPPFPNAFGDHDVTDANGIVWNPQTGGYFGASGPSVAYATNINNGGTTWRFVDQPGDSDILITQAERAEVSSSSANFAPGQVASFFSQFRWDAYTTQSGDWCYQNQIHYNDDLGNGAPDIFAISCKDDQLQIVYQNDSATVPCGSPVTLTQGVAYALEGEITWSASHAADAIDVWIGVNGASLTHQCTATGALFPNDTGAYLKLGIYRGFSWANDGTIVLNEMNTRWSTTANAYSAYRTTQPALPTHP